MSKVITTNLINAEAVTTCTSVLSDKEIVNMSDDKLSEVVTNLVGSAPSILKVKTVRSVVDGYLTAINTVERSLEKDIDALKRYEHTCAARAAYQEAIDISSKDRVALSSTYNVLNEWMKRNYNADTCPEDAEYI